MSALEVRPSAEENGSEEGLRILSFDGGGPGSYSQLLMLREFIKRLEWDNRHQEGVDSDEESDFDEDTLCPADYFDVMGGVGFGAYCALMLGRLRLSIERAIEELITVAHTMFPNTPSEILSPDANSERLKGAVEDMLRRNGDPIDMPLKGNIGQDRECKVVVFLQATSTPGNCTPFRTYRVRSGQNPKCTFVEAACAALSELPEFSPVAIGPARQATAYAGVPLGFNNPTRKVLNEALMTFGEKKPVSLILSLGAGKPSTPPIQISASFDSNSATLLTRIAMDSERVDDELVLQLAGVDLYLRLHVDRGLEDIKNSDWHHLGTLGAHTQRYLGNGPVTTNIDKALRSLCAKDHISFAQLNGAACQAVCRVPIEQRFNGLGMEIKNMRDFVIKSVKKITIIDAIGNHTSIPFECCATYEMLQDMIKFYFKHQKVPGGSFVSRGDYKLVYGDNRRTVKPSEWTYLQAPNLTLEVSMVVKTQGRYTVRCPKCDTEFRGKGRNGWAVCPNQKCKMRYQYHTKPYRFFFKSEYTDPTRHSEAVKDNKLSRLQAETSEGVEKFRLVSVVHQNEYPRRRRVRSGLSLVSIDTHRCVRLECAVFF